MTKSSPTPTQDTITQLSAIKGVDYKTMMKRLCRLSNQVPPEVDDRNPNFISMVIIEHELTHAKNAAQNYPTHLTESLTSIEQPLGALESKRDARLLPSDLQEYAQLKAEVKERGGQREQLTQEINTYIKTTRDKFIQIAKKLADKTPRTQKQTLPAELTPIEKQATEFFSRANKVNVTENALQRRLYRFFQRISQAAHAATGIKAPPIKAPKPE